MKYSKFCLAFTFLGAMALSGVAWADIPPEDACLASDLGQPCDNAVDDGSADQPGVCKEASCSRATPDGPMTYACYRCEPADSSGAGGGAGAEGTDGKAGEATSGQAGEAASGQAGEAASGNAGSTEAGGSSAGPKASGGASSASAGAGASASPDSGAEAAGCSVSLAPSRSRTGALVLAALGLSLAFRRRSRSLQG